MKKKNITEIRKKINCTYEEFYAANERSQGLPFCLSISKPEIFETVEGRKYDSTRVIERVFKGELKVTNAESLKSWKGFITKDEKATFLNLYLHNTLYLDNLKQSGLYTAYQLKALEKGVKCNVDIRQYANPHLEPAKMNEYRLSLLRNVNIYPYITENTTASEMCEIRLGLEHNVDISKYVNKGYNNMVMQEIRLGLENRIDLTGYAKKGMTALQLKEIRRGLMLGLDVKSYAKRTYDHRQMQEMLNELRKQVN